MKFATTILAVLSLSLLECAAVAVKDESTLSSESLSRAHQRRARAIARALMPANDDICGATQIVVYDFTAYNNIGATAQDGEISPGAGSVAGDSCNSQDGWCRDETNVQNSIWFTFVAPAGLTEVTIETDNTDDLQLALYEDKGGDDCNDLNIFDNLEEVAANDDSGAGLSPEIICATVSPLARYFIQLDGWGNPNPTVSSGSIRVTPCGFVCGTSVIPPTCSESLQCCDFATNAVGPACCGSVPFDPTGLQCCGSETYDPTKLQCCDGDLLVDSEASCPAVCVDTCTMYDSEEEGIAVCTMHNDDDYHNVCVSTSDAPLIEGDSLGDRTIEQCGCCDDGVLGLENIKRSKKGAHCDSEYPAEVRRRRMGQTISGQAASKVSRRGGADTH